MIFKSHTDLTDLTDLFFRCKQRVFSFGLNGKTPKESKIREIREIRVGKLNIKHSKLITMKVNRKSVINFVITVLTAVLSSFCMQSCK